MESTGVYWRPVFNILEPHVTESLAPQRPAHQERAGPQDRRQGCRVDRRFLLRHGLVRGSFIPPGAQIRELRDADALPDHAGPADSRRMQPPSEVAGGWPTSSWPPSPATSWARAAWPCCTPSVDGVDRARPALANLARGRLRGQAPPVGGGVARGDVSEHPALAAAASQLHKVERPGRRRRPGWIVKIAEVMPPFRARPWRSWITIPGVNQPDRPGDRGGDRHWT